MKKSKTRKLKEKYCKFLEINLEDFPKDYIIHHICGRHIPDPDNVYNLYAMPKSKHEFWSHNKERRVLKGRDFNFQTGFYEQPNEIWEIINCEDLRWFNTPCSIHETKDWKKLAKYWRERQEYKDQF